jgi:hypothetical protein
MTSAHNILLFTLISDNEGPEPSSREIWNIFYHLYLDEHSLALLLVQCRKLINASVDIKHWLRSKYGFFLKPCNRHSLARIRKLWIMYAETAKFSPEDKSTFEKALQSKLKSSTEIHTAPFRPSAGPLTMDTISMMKKQFENFWDTGTTLPQNKHACASFPNPAFAYSTSKEIFALAKGAYPLASFHLFSAFAATLSSKPSRSSGTTVDIVGEARKQFDAWCRVFKASLKTPRKIVIRFFTGDVSVFCGAIGKNAANSNEYDRNATFPAPMTFDTIDTSQLANHTELLKIITSTIPLLNRESSATLYTETFESGGEDSTIRFLDRFCGNDLSIVSVLFDITPPAYVSGYNSYSNIHDIISHRVVRTPLYD